MRARRVLRGLLLCGVLAAPLTLLAQASPPKKPSTDQTTAPGQQKKKTNEKTPPAPVPENEPAPTSSTREFKPSEAVSSDQEVDFPADL
jgi:hypothetical protein